MDTVGTFAKATGYRQSFWISDHDRRPPGSPCGFVFVAHVGLSLAYEYFNYGFLGRRTAQSWRSGEPPVRMGSAMDSTATSQTPFYAALPYNDIDGEHHTKPEAARVIPWFKSAFVEDGRSVCRRRWIEIRHRGRVCYARWEDVGPFQTDHWQYVFGYERPRPNRNNDAGLDVSPAVREYLGLNGLDVCDWRFVTSAPPGPWSSSVRPSIVNAFHGPQL